MMWLPDRFGLAMMFRGKRVGVTVPVLTAHVRWRAGFVRWSRRYIYWRINAADTPRWLYYSERSGFRRVLLRVGRLVVGCHTDRTRPAGMMD